MPGSGYCNRGQREALRLSDESHPASPQHLEAFEIYHPYEDVERMRVLYSQGETGKSAMLADRLTAQYRGDFYIRYYAGEAKWRADEKEQAFRLWTEILEENPQHYAAKLGAARYHMEQEEYNQARQLLLELLDADGRDEAAEAMIRRANEALIDEYYGKLERGEEDPQLPGGELIMRLGWCLFQNERLEEADRILADFRPDEEQEYLYYDLYGRLLYQMDQQERVLPYLEHWLEMIRVLREDGTEETRKRMGRHGSACYILSGCYYSLGRQEDAERVLHEAVQAAGKSKERLEYMQYLANIRLWSEQYEKSIDVCDQIIKEDEQYYPAYLIRQEACYHLRKAQQVVDDHYRAIRIYPGYYKPYLLAAEVFFFHDQFEDARGVIDRARENHVEFSLKMKLFEVKILRNLAEKREERDVPRAILEEIRQTLSRKENPVSYDIEDLSEVAYEMGLLWWDDDEFDRSLEYLAQAIRENPERLQYRLIRGDVYREMKRYEDALAEYHEAEPDYGERPGIHYSRGLCLEGLGRKNEAAQQYLTVLKISGGGYRDAFEKLSDYYKDRFVDYGHREDYEKALFYINQQLKEKENCYYLVCRGLIYDEAMEQELAIQDYKKALEYSPEKWIVWNNMGCSYKYRKQYEEAIRCCEKALELLGEGKSRLPYRNLADCYKALGEKETAIEWYRKGLEVSPDYEYFWEEIGDLYYDLNRLDDALEAYEHTKSRTNHYKDIGDVWLKRGDLERGIQCYEEGIRLADDSQKAARLSGLGDLYLEELRAYEKAAECYRKAAEIEEDYYQRFDYKRYLARAYFMMEDYEKAARYAQEALEDFRQSGRNEEDYLAFRGYAPARYATFGWIYLCLGDEEKAGRLFEEMDQMERCKSCRFGRCFESPLYLAYLHQCRGEREQAAFQFHQALEWNPDCREAQKALEFLEQDPDRKADRKSKAGIKVWNESKDEIKE